MGAGPGEASRGPPVEGPVCHAKGCGLSCEGHRVPYQLCSTAEDKVAMQGPTACIQKLQAWQVPSAHIPGESWPRNPTRWSRLQPYATLTCQSESPMSDKGSACVKRIRNKHTAPRAWESSGKVTGFSHTACPSRASRSSLARSRGGWGNRIGERGTGRLAEQSW